MTAQQRRLQWRRQLAAAESVEGTATAQQGRTPADHIDGKGAPARRQQRVQPPVLQGAAVEGGHQQEGRRRRVCAGRLAQ
jgi:hypothetical protein